MADQVPTAPVSVRWIMSDPAFERGVRDARAGRPLPADFDDWEINDQWNYERGHAWGKLAPRVQLKHDGRVTDEAVRSYLLVGRGIL
jgi:hypothetical protein